mmetsp:Transcript_25379/g.58464  ORF Transcript_25379/g.58464 Transcript_25379/m.58464 type:complete len:448 (-) Transcript_25379:248-1591(-)
MRRGSRALELVEASGGRRRGLVNVEHSLTPLLALQHHSFSAGGDGGELGRFAAIMPDVHHLIRSRNNVSFSHCQISRFNGDVLGINRRPDRVTEDKYKLWSCVCSASSQDRVLPNGANRQQLFYILGIFLIILAVPENDAVLWTFRLVESIHQRVPEETPLVVWADVGEKDERIHGEGDTETTPLPGESLNSTPRHAQCAQMNAKRRVELDHAELLVTRRAARLLPSHCHHCAVGVPGHTRNEHPGVDEDRFLVNLVAHKLHAAVFICEGEARSSGVRHAFEAVVPADTGQRHKVLAGKQGHAHHKVTMAVIAVNLSVRRYKQNRAPVWGPLDQGERQFQLLAPQAISIHRTNDHSTILVHDANLLPVRGPFHVSHHTLVSVVDHFLKPLVLVQVPHNDQPRRITCGQFAIVLVPSHNHNSSAVALKRLVHGKVARTSNAPLLTSAC